MARRVQLFYDVLSPYSWIAFEVKENPAQASSQRTAVSLSLQVLFRYQRRWNISLDLCPFFLSGIMQGAGVGRPQLDTFTAISSIFPLSLPLCPLSPRQPPPWCCTCQAQIHGEGPGEISQLLQDLPPDTQCMFHHTHLPCATQLFSPNQLCNLQTQNVKEVLFVKGSLSAMRLLTATKAASQEHVEVLSRQLWNRVWGTVCGFCDC